VTGSVASAADTILPNGRAARVSVADELAKLDRLRDEGVMTEAEFEAQKARLLGPS